MCRKEEVMKKQQTMLTIIIILALLGLAALVGSTVYEERIKENKKAGVDLSLSGHTHAGQIWPTGQLGELIGVTELNYGHRQDGDYQVIVSSGIGGWGYPIRTGGHSEYVVITLNTKK